MRLDLGKEPIAKKISASLGHFRPFAPLIYGRPVRWGHTPRAHARTAGRRLSGKGPSEEGWPRRPAVRAWPRCHFLPGRRDEMAAAGDGGVPGERAASPHVHGGQQVADSPTAQDRTPITTASAVFGGSGRRRRPAGGRPSGKGCRAAHLSGRPRHWGAGAAAGPGWSTEGRQVFAPLCFFGIRLTGHWSRGRISGVLHPTRPVRSRASDRRRPAWPAVFPSFQEVGACLPEAVVL